MSTTRRDFLTKTAMASAAIAAAPLVSFANMGKDSLKESEKLKSLKDRLFPAKFGIGGVGLGNGWHVNTNEQITETLQAAWDAGVRFFDTAPLYGFTLSERRLGHFLLQKPREEFVISTKIGRIFESDKDLYKAYDENAPESLWRSPAPFKYKYDYSAAGVRRSVEDSLQRMGLSTLDFVLVHDLSPDTPDLGDKWVEHFEIAKRGAFPELTKMREEGIIKAWGLGVNTPQPIMKALEVADPNIMLVAIQYSLFEHKNALNKVMPALVGRNIQAIIGGPLNGGFAAGKDRWNYGGTVPPEMLEKRKKVDSITSRYGIDTRTVALQFSAAHPAVGAVIPGASRPEQSRANVESFSAKIPADLWKELEAEKLIEQHAPVGL